MRYRLLSSLVALLAASLFVSARATVPAAHSGHMMECAKTCADCMLQCASCARHCADLTAEGKKEFLTTQALCCDCANFCSISARIASHDGPMADAACAACAKACDRCEAACAKYPKDEHMVRCATACRECSRSCREMVKHMASGKDK